MFCKEDDVTELYDFLTKLIYDIENWTLYAFTSRGTTSREGGREEIPPALL